ncbi:aldolase [Viridothelium virens]|uniref:Aldolase n=1 Tax=Viridothelium virens TaxID=1048519 RepID=A0A6A6GTJ6_VIRVR|nr:aldolase [Viridothelium virens]
MATNGTNGAHKNTSAIDPEKFKKLFFTPVVPFLHDDPYTIDYENYRSFIHRFMKDEYLEQGIAIIANPEAGELFTLEREERKKVLQICIEEAAGRCPVIAGVVHVHTKGYIKTAKDAQELGADGLFIFPPIGAGDIVAIWDSDKYPEIFSNIIQEVSAAVPLPIVIHPVGRYSIPFGQGLPIGTTKAILDACPNIVGWKMTYNFDGYRKIARFLQRYSRPVNILAAVGHYMHENHADRMFDGLAEGRLEDSNGSVGGRRLGRTAAVWTERPVDDDLRSIFEDIGRLHVRYKTAVWLRGLIKTPVMRPPMPKPRLAEIREITQALVGAKLEVIPEAKIQTTIKSLDLVL